MPGMLGWFRMTPETTVEDIEWMLARSAAFDAGYAFVTSFEALEGNGRTPEILALIGLWEEARMADVFSPDQKRRMESVSNEFHLEDADNQGWVLHQIHTNTYRFESRERQPGEPSHQSFSFQNPEGEQPLAFILTAVGGAVEGISMELDGVSRVALEGRLQEGEALVYQGGERAVVYSRQWKVLRSLPMDPAALRVAPGEHGLVLDGRVRGGEDAHLRVELRIRGAPEQVAPR